jgi:inosine kinase
VRFPGQRIAKHYFPVSGIPQRSDPNTSHQPWYLLGLDQLLVDLEVHASEDLADKLGLGRGESMHLDDDRYRQLLDTLDEREVPVRYAAGGTVANTLSNYAMLAGEPAVLLGALPGCITPGDAAFHYVAQTPRAVDLSHVRAVEGMTGTAVTFIFPDGERSFAVAPGVSNAFPPEAMPAGLIEGAAVATASLYTLIDAGWPIAKATHQLFERARDAGVPVAFGLGTAGLVERMREQVQALLSEYVCVAAMNAREAEALTGIADPLLACQRILDWVDVVLVTQGAEGLTLGGWAERSYLRPTRNELRSAALAEFNRHEYSRLWRRKDCRDPVRIYSQIPPYHGGPERIGNCSGAGDAALAAVLHDLAANRFHRAEVPDSAKHHAPFLSYSSLSRIAQYGNRVAYEVLRGNSPRLDRPPGRDEPASSATPPSSVAEDDQLPLFRRRR